MIVNCTRCGCEYDDAFFLGGVTLSSWYCGPCKSAIKHLDILRQTCYNIAYASNFVTE